MIMIIMGDLLVLLAEAEGQQCTPMMTGACHLEEPEVVDVRSILKDARTHRMAAARF